MLVQTLTIARNTLIESLRQPIFFVLIVLSGLFQALNTAASGFSMGYTTSAEVSGDNKMLLDVGLATIFVTGMLLAAFQATAVISREIENKTILTIVSKPISRPTIIFGKYLGVSGAIFLAMVVMATFLMFGIRHEVMTKASDTIDMPVVVFSLSTVLLSILIAGWTNFFYGWSFTQVAVILMGLFVPLGYIITLMISPDWQWQSITTDLKPQILLACAALVLAVLVMSAVAVAASTRLSQVMTIVVCIGVFVFGLLSNYMLGRRAFVNHYVAIVDTATPQRSEFESFAVRGARYDLTLENFPSETLSPGTPIYYGPSPQGLGMPVPAYAPFEGDPTDKSALVADDTPPALMVKESGSKSVVIQNIGGHPLAVSRPPQSGDYLFTKRTRIHPLAVSAWAVVPNMQYFWLLDAVTQNRTIPPRHIGLLAVYSVFQIGAILSIAVILFQRHDVG